MANESETNCCRLHGHADDDNDQHAIKCLSTRRDSTAYQPHRRHRHHCCCHENESNEQTKTHVPPILTSDDVASTFVSRRSDACFERRFSRRPTTSSTSSSTESFHKAPLFKSKQCTKRPITGRCHQEVNKIFGGSSFKTNYGRRGRNISLIFIS